MTNGQQPARDKGTPGAEWFDGFKDSKDWIRNSEWPLGKPIQRRVSRPNTPESKYTPTKVTNTFDHNVRVLAEEIAATVSRKQKDYGPNNIRKSPFGPLIGLTVRLYDKIARLANLSSGDKKPQNESLRDTFVDIAGYGIIGLMILDGTFPEE